MQTKLSKLQKKLIVAIGIPPRKCSKWSSKKEQDKNDLYNVNQKLWWLVGKVEENWPNPAVKSRAIKRLESRGLILRWKNSVRWPKNDMSAHKLTYLDLTEEGQKVHADILNASPDLISIIQAYHFHCADDDRQRQEYMQRLRNIYG